MTHEDRKLGDHETSQGRACGQRAGMSQDTEIGKGWRGDRAVALDRQAGWAGHTAGCLGMLQGELSPCRPNGGIPWQDKAKPTPPEHSCSGHAPQGPVSCPSLEERGQSTQNLAFQPSSLLGPSSASPKLTRGHSCDLWEGHTTRAPSQSRPTLPATWVQGTTETAADSPESLAASPATLGNLSLCPTPPSGRDLGVTPPPRQESSHIPPRAPTPHCPHLEVLINTSCYCPLRAPNPGAQNGRGLSA